MVAESQATSKLDTNSSYWLMGPLLRRYEVR